MSFPLISSTLHRPWVQQATAYTAMNQSEQNQNRQRMHMQTLASNSVDKRGPLNTPAAQNNSPSFGQSSQQQSQSLNHIIAALFNPSFRVNEVPLASRMPSSYSWIA